MDINGLVVIGALFGLFIYLLYAIFAYYKAKRKFDKKRTEIFSPPNEEGEMNYDSSDLQHPTFSSGDLRYDYHLTGPITNDMRRSSVIFWSERSRR